MVSQAIHFFFSLSLSLSLSLVFMSSVSYFLCEIVEVVKKKSIDRVRNRPYVGLLNIFYFSHLVLFCCLLYFVYQPCLPTAVATSTLPGQRPLNNVTRFNTRPLSSRTLFYVTFRSVLLLLVISLFLLRSIKWDLSNSLFRHRCDINF